MIFIDAQQQAIDTPDTFKVPSLKHLRAFVEKKDFLKICYASERFWVEVITIEGNTVTGSVANELISAPFAEGEIVRFELCNVYAYMPWQTARFTDDDNIENMEQVHVACNKD